MLPNTHGDGVNLEDRLRGLILNNANINSVTVESSMPPHYVPEGDAKSSRQGETRNILPIQDTSSPNQASYRKRPNQAQRRQMNSQLSIPIDPRPNNGAPAGRGAVQYGAVSNVQRVPNTYKDRGQVHQYQKPDQQHYSPRFQQSGPGSPYSPRSQYPQVSPQPPVSNYQPRPSPTMPLRPGHNQYPQHQQPNAQYPRPPVQNRQLYQPGSQNMSNRGRGHGQSDELLVQSSYLESLVQTHVPGVGVDQQEESEKEAFRALVENVCREAITEYERNELKNEKFEPYFVELQCFGSMRSGFATKASDMDLALLTPKSNPTPDCPESAIPRILEKKLLSLGYGARLLTRTRVPIIKLCQLPTEKLLSDLRTERMKWESGFAAGDEDEENEDIEAPEATNNAGKVADHTSTDLTIDLPKTLKTNQHGEKSSLLVQKENQSLGEYHNLAKRHLRKLGGRDVTSNSPSLTEEEGEILNSVCKALILGLSNKGLSSRLQSYASITPLFDSSIPTLLRSLQGVATQAEGERLSMAWESRTIVEATESRESEYFEWVSSWRALQGALETAADPVAYNRQLNFGAEKLKRVASLQLLFLSQIQNEGPTYYYTRAQKIMEDLRRKDSQANEEMTPIFVSQYIKGISNLQLQSALQNANHPGLMLSRAGTYHRALQLAADFEHALKSDFYNAEYKEDVQGYIQLLRKLEHDGTNGPTGYVDDVLLAKIRSLSDPAELNVSKPRDRFKDRLEFPKTDVGIQCDINFSAQLAIHNTLLLRCYAASDPRVKPMILFVKHWAKVRGINTTYRGTLSSYGYVLMVLHYLVNIAQPFVCPNLQLVQKDPPKTLSPPEIEARTTCQGCDVRFWRNEAEIRNLAERKMLNHNHDSVGMLLRGFFEYFAQSGQMTTVQGRGFDWGREVLSLRTYGGILTKQDKGWVGAKTVIETSTIAAPSAPSTIKPSSLTETPAENEEDTEVKTPKTPKPQMKTVEETKEIRHRYLFAIEDPFELDHNVARTVMHHGIVNIRDEFRRAWRIIRGRGKSWEGQDGGLLDALSTKDKSKGLHELMDLLHGPAPKTEVVKDEK